jgi:acetolactate synthase-1/2/3 large subunit
MEPSKLSSNYNVGDLVAEFLARCGVRTGFGIISVHNIPMLDAISRRGDIRFVMTRGEMGAGHMADGYARVTGELGVLISSTGPGAANAVSGLVEAGFAGSPVLHLTGQVPSHLIGRETGTTHDVPDQLGMLRSVCKSAYRIRSAAEAWGILVRAATDALTPPMGPVSIEIPIDIQKSLVQPPPASDSFALPLPAPHRPSEDDLDRLAERVLQARRPMLWVGSGARHAGAAVSQLLDMGFGMVSSWAGRGIVPEDHPMSLGGLNGTGVSEVQAFYETVDLMLVVGSRLRGQETVDFSLPLPSHRIQIDIDPKANGRTYTSELFIHGDTRLTLEGLIERIQKRMQIDPAFPAQFRKMKTSAREEFKGTLGPYGSFAEQLRALLPRDTLWARDITIANSTWGNRLFELYGPRDGLHPVGAGIGQGLPLGIGAAAAAGQRKTVVLTGDGGFMMNICELWTAIQEKLNLVVIIMNDSGYGVIRHMQDAAFGGRRLYGDLFSPSFEEIAKTARAYYEKVTNSSEFGPTVKRAIERPGLAIVEVDMVTIGEAPAYFPYNPKKA